MLVLDSELWCNKVGIVLMASVEVHPNEQRFFTVSKTLQEYTQFVGLDLTSKDWDFRDAILNCELQPSIPDFPSNSLKYVNIPQNQVSRPRPFPQPGH